MLAVETLEETSSRFYTTLEVTVEVRIPRESWRTRTYGLALSS